MQSTFLEMSDSDFETYADDIVQKRRDAASRQQAVSYLQSVVSADKTAVDQSVAALRGKRRTLRKRQQKIDGLISDHAFDFSKQPDLFLQQSLRSDAELVNDLAVNNQTLFVKGKTLNGNFIVQSDNIKIDGEATGNAKDGTLVCDAVVTGTLILQGDTVHIKGVKFISTGDKAITIQGSKNIVIEDCIFVSGAGSDTKWFYGAGIADEANITINNCVVENFTSWYLADFSTSSATPTVQIKELRVTNCHFKNNKGCMACRGMQTNPNKLCVYQNNKFESAELSANFWDFAEANNTKRVVFKDNEIIAPVGTENEAGKKGIFQVWSRSSKPWVLIYEGNKAQNIKFGLKIPCTNTFYAPNTDDDDFKIDLSGVHTNVTYAASFLYKKNDGTQASALKYHPGVGNDYTPTNIDAVPSIPVINPNGLAIVE